MKKLLLLLMSIMLVGCGQSAESQVSSPATISKDSKTPTIGPKESTISPTTTSKSPNLSGIPAGWQWISGVRARVAVPASYVGGSPENLRAIAAQLPEAGMDSNALAELLSRYVGPANLFAIDRSTLAKAFPTNLSVALDGNPKTRELDLYMADAVKDLAGDWQVQKQEKIRLGHRQFGRIRATALKSPVTAIIYITAEAEKFWLLNFTVDSGNINLQRDALSDPQQADFQKIADSLRWG